METGGQVGSAAELALAAAPSAAPPVAVHDDSRAAGSSRLEIWAGRACLCWLAAAAPLLVTGDAASDRVVAPAVAAAVWLAIAVVAEESGRERRPAFGVVPRALALALAGLGVLSILDWWAPALAPPKSALVVSAVLIAATGAVWDRLARRADAHTRRVLVVGEGASARTLAGAIDEAATSYAVAAVVPSAVDLCAALERVRPDVVVADERDHAAVVRAVLDACRDDVVVADVLEFHEHVFGRLPLAELHPSWFVSAVHLYRRPYGRIAKRVFDLVVSCCALALTAPLFAVVALLVWSTPGPVLYRQTREGAFGRPFTIYKFRTMVEDAEGDGGAVWALARDPRATAVGRVLRRLRIDELPQLWNVLRGTMSVVGPRPERPELSALLSSTVPYWSHRLLLKPGITGWAQVNAGYAADAAGAESKLSYDLWYLRHRSLLVDAAICLRTLARVAAGSR